MTMKKLLLIVIATIVLSGCQSNKITTNSVITFSDAGGSSKEYLCIYNDSSGLSCYESSRYQPITNQSSD